MLIIRDAQMTAFRRAGRYAFVQRMCSYLRRHLPDVLDDTPGPELEKRVGRCVDRAAAYGLAGERDVALFIALAAHYGWEFDTDPDLQWMHSCLTDSAISLASQRIELLVKRSIHRQNVEAATAAARDRFQSS